MIEFVAVDLKEFREIGSCPELTGFKDCPPRVPSCILSCAALLFGCVIHTSLIGDGS